MWSTDITHTPYTQDNWWTHGLASSVQCLRCIAMCGISPFAGVVLRAHGTLFVSDCRGDTGGLCLGLGKAASPSLPPDSIDIYSNSSLCSFLWPLCIANVCTFYFTAVLYFFIIRPHRSIMYVDSAYSYRPSSMVCQLHSREPCKNGWTNWDASWVEDSDGPKKPCVRWGSHPPWEGAILGWRGGPL